MGPFEIYFSEEDVKQNLHLTYIDNMLKLGAKLERQYVDLRVRNDDVDQSVVVQVVMRYWDSNCDYEHFEHIDESDDKVVMYKIEFPDNHYDYVSTNKERQALVEEWLKENPDYEYDWKYNIFSKKEE